MKAWQEWLLIVVVEAAVGAFVVAAATRFGDYWAETRVKPKKKKAKPKKKR
jgi:hypothetical protein